MQQPSSVYKLNLMLATPTSLIPRGCKSLPHIYQPHPLKNDNVFAVPHKPKSVVVSQTFRSILKDNTLTSSLLLATVGRAACKPLYHVYSVHQERCRSTAEYLILFIFYIRSQLNAMNVSSGTSVRTTSHLTHLINTFIT